MTTTDHETISETLPLVKCASWCEDGDGHPAVTHPDDQFCSSEPREVTLSRYPLIEVAEGRLRRDYLEAHLYQDNGAVSAHVQLAQSGAVLITLSIDEAEQLAAALSALVKVARV